MLPALFFASGALGLVYEVLWMRRFTALFGATTLATTATLSGFFLGTALGSAVFGERSQRWRRPLLAFGVLEVGVGLGALLVGPLLDLYHAAYPALYPRLSGSPLAFALLKLALAVVAVGLPTFCMGGTLPALGEAVAAGGGRLGAPVGALYAVNLLGAALGTLVVPVVLLPRLGLKAAYSAAVAGSLCVGVTACVLGALSTRRAPDVRSPARSERSARPVPRLVLALAGLSGACTLALQVSWTRMFALVHENSQAAFAVVLFVFLAGLAGGAAIARQALRRGRPPRRVLAIAWAAAGLLVAVTPRLFYTLTDELAYVTAADAGSSLGRIVLLGLATMLPAAVALGTAVPLVLELASPDEKGSPGVAIGHVLAANTLGAIAGPLCATFVMGPRLGLWSSLVVLGGVLVAGAAGAGLARAEAAIAVAALAAVAVFDPHMPPVRIRAASGERLVSVREGTHGTTAVLADAHDRWITVNNSYVLGGTAASDEERWQAHLPLLLHPSPRRVAFLGMGTGITAGAALGHPVERLVALEIVPEVATAAREDFADFNAGVMGDPRVSVVIDDGRNYLAALPRGFDVVVGDLLVPWRPAEAPLYTAEHFASVRRSLAAGGLFCQWLPLYQLSEAQLASVVRTFVEVFPHTSLWRGNFLARAPTLALIGHAGADMLETAAIDARVQGLADRETNPFLAHPAGLWLFFVGPVPPGAPWLTQAPRNTDDEPWIELSGAPGTDGAATVDRVTPFLEEVASGLLEGTPFEGIGGTHAEWRRTGAALARAASDAGPEGEAKVLQLLRTLPPELRSSLDVAP